MSDNIKELIIKHQRRLQKLEVQRAHYGINTPPEVLIEIEDIESIIAELRTQLEEAVGKQQTSSLQSGLLASDQLVGRQLGKYYILAHLGQNNIANIFKAHDSVLSRFVLIKVIHEHLTRNTEFIKRLNHEVARIARLSHPGIARVFDFGHTDGLYHVVVEFIEGPSLEVELAERRVKKQLFTPTETVPIFSSLAKVLDYAHKQKVFHHALKPSNIMFTEDGHLILTDFQLSSLVTALNNNSDKPTKRSTPYMSPEQIAHQQGNGLSDIYSLGLILREMLTGSPFVEDHPDHTTIGHTLPLTNVQIPAAVEQVISKASHPQPADRYQSVRKMVEDLQAACGVMETRPILSQPDDFSESTETPPLRPYKFLHAYDTQDATIFFGRDRERWQLLSKISAYRLLLLYGKSGTGKSSLIKAGLIPALTKRGFRCVYARTYSNPYPAIVTAINNALPRPIPEQPKLHDFLRLATETSPTPLILFIDQLEELFTQVDVATKTAFIEDIGKIYNDSAIQLKLVFSFREDFFADLNEFKPFIFDIFYNEYRLNPLSLERAREVIIGPVMMYGLSYGEGLIEQLITDLSDKGSIAPPQLQIVCDALYDALETDDRQITAYHYREKLGGAQAILVSYLDRVIKQYDTQQQAVIRKILKAFITSANTKAVLTSEELVQRARLPREQVEVVLEELLQARLVQSTEDKTRFELVHEYLINRIAMWMDDQERNYQRAREVLEQGLIKWNRYSLLLSEAELSVIDTQRTVFTFDDDTRELLVYSSIWSGYSADYWLEQATPPLRTAALRQAILDKNDTRRLRAVTYAGQFSSSELNRILGNLMQAETVPRVRREAALSLAKADKTRCITRIKHMLKSNSAQQQQFALEAVAYIQDTEPELLDFNEFAGPNLRWRLRGLRWWRNRAIWGWTMLATGIGGAAGAAIGGFWGALLSGLPEAFNKISFLTLFGIILGFLIGAGVGLGFGSVRAAYEPRKSVWHVILAALGGAIFGMFFGAMGENFDPYLAMFGIMVGLTAGLTSGAITAIIYIFTYDIPNTTIQLITRLAVGLVGSLVPGLIFAWGVEIGVLPLAPIYGLGLGLMVFGILTGLEIVDRQFAHFSH